MLVAKLANQRIADEREGKENATDGFGVTNSTESSVEDAADSDEVNKPCQNCSNSIAELRMTLDTQKAKIVELEQRQAQHEKKMQENAIALADRDADVGGTSPEAATGGEAVDSVPSTFEDCIDGDCDLLRALPSIPAADTTEVMRNARMTKANLSRSDISQNGTSENASSVCVPVSIMVTNSSCPHKVVSVSGRACADDLTFADAKAICKARGMGLCKHAELEQAYSCGFRSESCGWTKTVVKAVKGNLIERLSEEHLEICDISNGASKTAGAYCC